MKKIMRIMVMAVVAVVMAAGFASCSKSDDNSSTTPDSGKSYTSVMNIKLNFSKDVLSVADFTITYLDENGQEKSEQITDATYTKTIKYNKTPATAKYTVSVKIKDTLPDKEDFDLAISDKSEAGKTDGTGNFSNLFKKNLTESTEGVEKAHVKEWFAKFWNNWTRTATID